MWADCLRWLANHFPINILPLVDFSSQTNDDEVIENNLLWRYCCMSSPLITSLAMSNIISRHGEPVRRLGFFPISPFLPPCFNLLPPFPIAWLSAAHAVWWKANQVEKQASDMEIKWAVRVSTYLPAPKATCISVTWRRNRCVEDQNKIHMWLGSLPTIPHKCFASFFSFFNLL